MNSLAFAAKNSAPPVKLPHDIYGTPNSGYDWYLSIGIGLIFILIVAFFILYKKYLNKKNNMENALPLTKDYFISQLETVFQNPNDSQMNNDERIKKLAFAATSIFREFLEWAFNKKLSDLTSKEIQSELKKSLDSQQIEIIMTILFDLDKIKFTDLRDQDLEDLLETIHQRIKSFMIEAQQNEQTSKDELS